MADSGNPNGDMLARAAPKRGRAAFWLWLVLLVAVAVVGRWYVWPHLQALLGSSDAAGESTSDGASGVAADGDAGDAEAVDGEAADGAGTGSTGQAAAARAGVQSASPSVGASVPGAAPAVDPETALVGLRSSVAQLQLQVSAAATGEGRLAELEHLLHMARQHAELETDPPTALRLLSAADLLLANSGDPRLLPVRAALANDIAQVRGQAEIDVEGTYLRIGALTASVPALPFQQPVFAGDPAAQRAANEDLWSRALRAAQGLVRVRTDRNADSHPALAQDAQAVVRQRIMLALDQAGTAVLRGEVKVYRAALNRADALVRLHAQTSALPTRRFRQELGQLASTTGMHAAVHISALDALAQVPRMTPPGLLPPPEAFGAPVAAPLEGVAQTLPSAAPIAPPARPAMAPPPARPLPVKVPQTGLPR